MKLDGMVFGMPPNTHVSDEVMKASMPTARIIPCEPKFSRGLSLFSLDEDSGKKKYQAILKDVGFSISDNEVNVAYLADNFPTDTFNNEYGETFLDRFAQAASSGLGDLSQIMGWRTFNEASTQGKELVDAVSGKYNLGSKAAELAKQADTGISNSLTTDKNKNMYKSIKGAMQSMATGARVDFPQVWKNSSYTPSYSMTVRLYNPNPGSEEATKKYIVGPIAALLALGVPTVMEDSSMYKWPLLCKVRSPGIYHLNAAYINSIAVIKGGDQQSIGYNQALGMCDVRIDFGSLYNSILAGPGSGKHSFSRPTLGSYLGGIGGVAAFKSQKTKPIQVASKGPDLPNKTPNEFLMKKNTATATEVTSSSPIKNRSSDSNKTSEEVLKKWGGH